MILEIFWGLSPKNLEFQGWGRGKALPNLRRRFGDEDSQNFRVFLGEIPKKHQNSGWGRGNEYWGFSLH